MVYKVCSFESYICAIWFVLSNRHTMQKKKLSFALRINIWHSDAPSPIRYWYRNIRLTSPHFDNFKVIWWNKQTCEQLERQSIFSPKWIFLCLFSDWKNAIQNRLAINRRLITHHCQTHNVQKPVFQNYGSEIVAAISLACHSIKLKPLKPRCLRPRQTKNKTHEKGVWV